MRENLLSALGAAEDPDAVRAAIQVAAERTGSTFGVGAAPSS